MTARPITDVLREVRKGLVVDRATQLMSEVVLAVLATGRAGKVVLTLNIKPNPGASDQILFAADVKKQEPQQVIPDAIFFVDDDGFLHRSDPRQLTIEYQGQQQPTLMTPAQAAHAHLVAAAKDQ